MPACRPVQTFEDGLGQHPSAIVVAPVSVPGLAGVVQIADRVPRFERRIGDARQNAVEIGCRLLVLQKAPKAGVYGGNPYVQTPLDYFNIDSFQAAPGWTRDVKSTGSGDSAVITKVTWTGGKVPTEEDSVFGFNASTTGSKTYVFKVRQTYSSGEVVDWSGP